MTRGPALRAAGPELSAAGSGLGTVGSASNVADIALGAPRIVLSTPRPAPSACGHHFASAFQSCETGICSSGLQMGANEVRRNFLCLTSGKRLR